MVIRNIAVFLSRQLEFRKFSSFSQTVMGARHVKSTKSHGKELLEECKAVIPPLTFDLHKGQLGRVGIIGGSKEYTGAPYFAGISSLKAGADLVHVFCSKDSSSVIKSYSPELIVHPLLDSETGSDEMLQWIDRLHSVVLGPGLGRDEKVLKKLESVIEYIRGKNLPLIVDADGLWLVTKNPQLVKDYHKAILTPNTVEFQRLFDACVDKSSSTLPKSEEYDDLMKELGQNVEPKETAMLCQALGNVTIIRKGKSDVICNGKEVIICDSEGSPRRCGGQGDLLSGFLGTFAHWSHTSRHHSFMSDLLSSFDIGKDFPKTDRSLLASYASCLLTRQCSMGAYLIHGRSTTSSDLIDQIHASFEDIFVKRDDDK